MPKAHRDRPPTYEADATPVEGDAAPAPIEGVEGHVPEGRPFKPLPEAVEGEQAEVVSEPDYDAWDYRELQAEAKERGLVATGTRDELVDRLRAHDVFGKSEG